ncbi:MAG: RDD family protein [Mycobacterium sp.]|nr:RDD family protein [Mycobacterium sp.]
MTVALDSDLDGVDGAGSERPLLFDSQLAGWWTRAGAFGIDVIAGKAAAAALLLVGWSAPERGWMWWLCLVLAALLVIAVAVNRWMLPSMTGWTLGRSIFGIAVVDRDGDLITEPAKLILRDLAHLLDTLPLFLGWLWPLIDRRERTFADLLLGTEVHNVGDPRPDWTRLATRVLAAVAALAVLAAALGYFLVIGNQRDSDRSREEIAVAGPKIVVDMLSYTAKSIDEDFARAQSLVTDGYRPELTKQQDDVRKAPVNNDYWVSNSAVLSSTARNASMLMLLQGQRGTEPNQRFVSASVRTEFEKVGRDWKLSNLIVLVPPKPAAAPPKPPEPAAKPAEPQPKPKEAGR